MKIKFGDFTLQPGLNAKDRWDLLRTKDKVMTSHPSMKSKYPKAKVGQIVGTTEEEIGYDLRLENAISKAIAYRLADNEDTTDLKGFIMAYKGMKEELESLLTV